jgi:hypothetical protein
MLLVVMWVVVRGAFHPLGLRQVVDYAAAAFLQACAPLPCSMDTSQLLQPRLRRQFGRALNFHNMAQAWGRKEREKTRAENAWATPLIIGRLNEQLVWGQASFLA